MCRIRADWPALWQWIEQFLQGWSLYRQSGFLRLLPVPSHHSGCCTQPDRVCLHQPLCFPFVMFLVSVPGWFILPLLIFFPGSCCHLFESAAIMEGFHHLQFLLTARAVSKVRGSKAEGRHSKTQTYLWVSIHAEGLCLIQNVQDEKYFWFGSFLFQH